MPRRVLLHGRCILSKFYIKPQLRRSYFKFLEVVSYRNSTSNHNTTQHKGHRCSLYLIEILHQTTTATSEPLRQGSLYLIEILHQTTTTGSPYAWTLCCILSKFYIKPQPMDDKEYLRNVVSYRNSTSNHNFSAPAIGSVFVVSYRNSTSNHNRSRVRLHSVAVVSYRNSTSNHNEEKAMEMQTRLYLIEILHQTTTLACVLVRKQPLYLIEILHQTTTWTQEST